jgi:hypothetical protein
MDQPGDGPAVPSLPPAAGYGESVISPRNGLGVVSLVLGVVGVVISAVTIWPTIGVFLGIAALAVGLAARARVKRGKANNRGIAIAGIVLGVAAIVLGLASLALTAVDLFYNFRHNVCTTPGSPPC